MSLGSEYLADHAFEMSTPPTKRRKNMYQNIATKVLTGEVRLSYEHLTKAYANANNPGQEPRFSVTLLIPKADVATKADIDQSIRAAYEKGVAENWKGARPQLRNALIYDGDGFRNDGSRFGPECAGHWVITAASKRRPQVVHISNLSAELAPEDIYSGMYARVTVNFYPFDVSGSRGVGCGLGNVLKTRDGEPLSGGASAASDFAGLEQPSAGFQQAAPAAPAAPQGYQPYQAQQYNAAPQMSGYGAATGGQPQYDPISGQPATADPFAGIPGISEELPFN